MRNTLASTLCLLSLLGGHPLALKADDLPRLVAFGDFGDVAPRYQRQNAELMAQIAAQDNFTAGLLLGDNFYPYGVSSVDDSQFMDKFVAIYSGLGIPFYAVLGNHDYGGLGKTNAFEGGDWMAQILFTHSKRNPSFPDGIKLWNMPRRYYRLQYNDILTVYALDTHPARYPRDSKGEIHHPINNANAYLITEDGYWHKQMAWLEKSLRESKTRWNMVIGHHPIVSDGKHGDNRYFYETIADRSTSLQEILCRYADLYMSGHEHSLQFFDDVGCDSYSNTPLPQIISGAGGTNDLVREFYKQRAAYKDNKDGFVTLDFDKKTLTARAYVIARKGQAHTGKAAYEKTYTPRRKPLPSTLEKRDEGSVESTLPLESSR